MDCGDYLSPIQIRRRICNASLHDLVRGRGKEGKGGEGGGRGRRGEGERAGVGE